MGTTRPAVLDRALPQTAAARARSLRFVVNPLVTHIRRHPQDAMAFLVEKFKEHRVTAIGEQHSPQFSAHGNENGCVRLFIRDLCRALADDSAARFRYFVVEFDEAAMEQTQGSWRTMAVPPGTVNRKAYWFASYMQHSLAFRDVFYAIAAEIPDSQLEVVGIDQRTGNMSAERAYDWILGTDIQQGPQETYPEYQRRRNAELDGRRDELDRASEAREATATRLFQERVLSRLGDDRALIYYGADHVREGRVEQSAGGFTENTFVRRLIAADNGLSGDDVYAVATVYPGTMRATGATTAESVRPGRRTDAAAVNLLRIFDVVRGEFPGEPNLGFDIDDARLAILPLDRNTAYPLGEQFDGCLVFADLNSWDGRAQPPAASQAQRGSIGLTITSVIPSSAYVGTTIFVYGFILNDAVEVAVLTRGPGDGAAEQRFPCTNVRVINENVLSAEVPSPGGFPVQGQWAKVEIRRATTGFEHSLQPFDRAVLRGAFRYRL